MESPSFSLQTYEQVLSVANRLHAPLECTIRPAGSERYSVEPSDLRLGPGETGRVVIRLKVVRVPNRK